MAAPSLLLPHPLMPKQLGMLRAVLSQAYRLVAVFCGKQWGKCLKIGSLVATPKGPIAIENIEPGQEVYSLDENYRIVRARVKNTLDTGLKEEVEVVTTSGRKISVSREHPFLTIDGWKKIADIEEGQFIATPRAYPLSTSDIYWDKIKSITYGAPVQMYDLEIEGTHNFIANDICVHNSTIGAIILAALVLKNWLLPHASYIAAAANYKQMEGGMMQSFRKVFDPLHIGHYNKNEHKYYLNNGHFIYFRSMDSSNALEGITDVQGIWADEAGQYPRMGWMNMQARASPNRAPIWITTTPYGLGSMYNDVYEPWEKNHTITVVEHGKEKVYKAREYIYVVTGWSHENPSFKENMALQLRRMGKEEFERNYSGTFQQMQGLVYQDFRRERHVLSMAEWARVFGKPYPYISDHWRITAGVDWGHNDPFAVVVVAYSPTGISYQVAEYLKHNLSAQDMVNALVELQAEWGIRAFFADHEPKLIEDCNRRGLNVNPTDKSAGVLYGIGQHKALIRTYRRFVFELCDFTVSAYQTYAWREQPNQQKGPHQKPSHLMSDLMDADRYNTIGNPDANAGAEVRAPFVPGADGELRPEWEKVHSNAKRRIEMVMKKSGDAVASFNEG